MESLQLKGQGTKGLARKRCTIIINVFPKRIMLNNSDTAIYVY